MKVINAEKIPSKPVEMEGSSNCSVRWLVGEADGAPTFAMRQFEVAPGGYTPRHFHDYEHEVFVLEGNGVVIEDSVEHPLTAGDVILVKPNEVHQFRNTGQRPMKFLCLIPNSAAGKNVTVAPECGIQ
ncbi:MAG: cupin domain-containing protein [Pirellulales bacterium]